MNIVIIHHHLNRGGVTSVIVNQLSALLNLANRNDLEIEVAIFFGGRAEAIDSTQLDSFDLLNLRLVTIPELEYDSRRTEFDGDEALASLIESQLRKLGFAKEQTVLHWHNHSLGKNRSVVPLIQKLAASGYRLLLQIHDLAEDFRADNYSYITEELAKQDLSTAATFPIANHIRYGVINRRDHDAISKAGIPKSSIVYLPNAVSKPNMIPKSVEAKRKFAERNGLPEDVPLLIYPVRGIRRKNLGEAILLTAIAKSPICLGLTLAPQNEIELSNYRSWKLLSEAMRLPIRFELGHESDLSFEENIAAADAILTTSVAEGFGMVFLESFAFGKNLVGRDLADITADFKGHGIQFEWLYSELRIPIECVNLSEFDRALRQAIDHTYDSFDRNSSSDEYENYLHECLEIGWIDFAKLTIGQQQHIVSSAVRDPRVRQAIQNLNSQWIERIEELWSGGDEGVIERNRKNVLEKFSVVRTADQLNEVYSNLVKTNIGEVQNCSSPNAILDGFLSLSKFHPLRVEVGPFVQMDDEESKFLKSIIRESLTAIEPISTGLLPKLKPLANIKAVLFDIYGTLLVSSSGDVGTDPAFTNQQRLRDERLGAMLRAYQLDPDSIVEKLKLCIEREHTEIKAAGYAYPEIEICHVWQTLIADAQTDRLVDEEGDEIFVSNPMSELREIALRSELQNNPVWKMPGFDRCLNSISRRGIPMGIVSNAQFYTALIVETLAECDLDGLGFSRSLNHFSYRIGRAKPDQFLYKLAAESLMRLGILPEEVLYVGNDMTKDVVPAKAVGFITGLFAGDERSLRCGTHGDPHLHPAVDLIFTDLMQIDTVLPDA